MIKSLDLMRILVCEEEPVILLDLINHLKNLGARNFLYTKDGTRLLYNINLYNPQLIITEVNFSKEPRGIELLESVRRNKNDAILIISTTNPQPEFSSMLCSDDKIFFLEKPFSYTSLQAVMQNVLREKSYSPN